MALGNNIIVSDAKDVRGVFTEGPVSGTPKPGTCMEVSPGVEPVNGRFTYRVYQPGTDGLRRPIIVLLNDTLRGMLPTTAYVTGEWGFYYFPVMGEHLNMLVANIGGTGDTFAIGDKFMIDSGTGKLIAVGGSEQSAPFMCMETRDTALTADVLVRCMYTGY